MSLWARPGDPREITTRLKIPEIDAPGSLISTGESEISRHDPAVETDHHTRKTMARSPPFECRDNFSFLDVDEVDSAVGSGACDPFPVTGGCDPRKSVATERNVFQQLASSRVQQTDRLGISRSVSNGQSHPLSLGVRYQVPRQVIGMVLTPEFAPAQTVEVVPLETSIVGLVRAGRSSGVQDVSEVKGIAVAPVALGDIHTEVIGKPGVVLALDGHLRKQFALGSGPVSLLQSVGDQEPGRGDE